MLIHSVLTFYVSVNYIFLRFYMSYTLAGTALNTLAYWLALG